jgi:hypothetical protein
MLQINTEIVKSFFQPFSNQRRQAALVRARGAPSKPG